MEIPATSERTAALWRPTLAAVALLGHDVVATMGTPGSADQGLSPFLPEGVDGGDLVLVTNSPSEEDVNAQGLAELAPYLCAHIRRLGAYAADELGTEPEALDPALDEIGFTVLDLAAWAECPHTSFARCLPTSGTKRPVRAA